MHYKFHFASRKFSSNALRFWIKCTALFFRSEIRISIKAVAGKDEQYFLFQNQQSSCF